MFFIIALHDKAKKLIKWTGKNEKIVAARGGGNRFSGPKDRARARARAIVFLDNSLSNGVSLLACEQAFLALQKALTSSFENFLTPVRLIESLLKM